MSVEILKGIPMPPDKRGKPAKWPWAIMEVGDCIKANARGVAITAYLYGKRHGKRFAMRTTEEGIRIWRTK